MIITSKSNPQIKEVAKLYDKKYRRINGLYLVEGTKPVDECVAAGGDIRQVICTEKFAARYKNPLVVSDDVFGAISFEKAPQGVIAVVKIPQTVLKPPQNSCILLDRLQDPGNLGTIIRTANAAGFDEIYMINCTDPYSPKAVRASMSGIFFATVYQAEREEILSALDGCPIICADMQGENIFGFNPPEKYCLCIGNEGSGIDEFIKNKADYKLKIPMRKTCESLNAAVSAGIAMYALKERNLK